jgi:hypothetical protein
MQFIDPAFEDTLTLQWETSYNPLELIDLYPAEHFADFATYSIYNIFGEHADTSRFDWHSVSYIKELDEKGVPINPSFPHNANGFYFVVNEVHESMTIELKGFHDQPVEFQDSLYYSMFLYEDLKPGEYEFIARPYANAPDDISLRYPFTILKPWWQQPAGTAGLTLATTLLIVGIVFAVYRAKQKRTMQELQWKQQLTDAELKAIRAQLNPHFLFNALNSIQNLVAKNHNEEANTYITKLSRLLRQVLSSSDQPYQELGDELKLMRLYLEIEQLRFPFSFEIQMDESVENHVLIPAMLLQPYLENAVKHGVSGMENGQINVKITAKDERLYIAITDNGRGLAQPNDNSSGLQLGSSMIERLYKGEASVSVQNREDTNGVTVQINLPLS